MHPSTFQYLKPTDQQMEAMAQLREAAKVYADHITTYVPTGPDQTYILRKLREVAMWANVAVTRHANGEPRSFEGPLGRDTPSGDQDRAISPSR